MKRRIQGMADEGTDVEEGLCGSRTCWCQMIRLSVHNEDEKMMRWV